MIQSLSAQERAAVGEEVALTAVQGVAGDGDRGPAPRARHGQRSALSCLLPCLVAALIGTCTSGEAGASGVGSTAAWRRSWERCGT